MSDAERDSRSVAAEIWGTLTMPREKTDRDWLAKRWALALYLRDIAEVILSGPERDIKLNQRGLESIGRMLGGK